MPSLALARNQRVWIDDAMHEVRGRASGDVVHLERVRDGEMRVVSHRDLAELICTDKAKLVATSGTGREVRIVEQNLEKDIGVLPPKVRAELDRRREYLKAVEEGGVLTLTERSLSGLICQVADTIGDAKPPHWTTIYRWVTRLKKASGDIRAVIPAFDRRGNRTRRLDGEIIRLIDEGIDRRFLKLEQPPGLTLWQHRVILAHAKRTVKGSIDVVQLARTREEMLAKAHEKPAGKKGTTLRSKIARFLGTDSREQTSPVAEPVEMDPTPSPPPEPLPQPPQPPPSANDGDWGGSYDLPPRR